MKPLPEGLITPLAISTILGQAGRQAHTERWCWCRHRHAADEVARRNLQDAQYYLGMHLTARHCNAAGMDLGLAEAISQHHHEHTGPGGLRNHHEDDLRADPRKAIEVVTEAREEPGERLREAGLHALFGHPGYEYRVTKGPRKAWHNADQPPEGEGWEPNTDAGRNGWERFEYHEEAYWRRPKADGAAAGSEQRPAECDYHHAITPQAGTTVIDLTGKCRAGRYLRIETDAGIIHISADQVRTATGQRVVELNIDPNMEGLGIIKTPAKGHWSTELRNWSNRTDVLLVRWEVQ